MAKTDFKKTIGAYQARAGTFSLVSVPSLQYLSIDGHGDPNTSPAYAEAIAAVYPLAYSLKFASKKNLDRDYVVTPLEALWWAEDMAAFADRRDKSQWNWTLLLMVPDWLAEADFEAALAAVAAKGGPPALDRVRLERMDEGLAVQTLHIGPFDDEGPVLAQMHNEFIPGQGLRPTGKHHEIYFSDTRTTEPSKLRSILRQPVEPVA